MYWIVKDFFFFTRYGVYIGLDVLHACSTSKIKSILEQNEILLRPNQVIHLFKKNEDLFKIYIDYSYRLRKNPYDEECVLNLLAYENPGLFLQLLKCNKISKIKLSKSASTIIVNIAKSEILDDPQYFYKILNTRALVSTLKTDFVTFYTTLTRKCPNLNYILKYLPKNKRWQTFYEVYKVNFPQDSIDKLFKTIHSNIIVLLNPGKQIVNAWAEVNYKINNDDKFLQYLPTSISIPILKQKINVTSNKENRKALLLLLITTCAENKDMKALDEVMEYVGSRHNNEDDCTHRKIIEFICKTFSNDELTKKHWDFILQQANLIRLKGTIPIYDYRNIIDKLLHYSYKNDKEMFKAVAKDFILDTAQWDACNFRTSLPNADLERDMFVELCKLLSEDHRNFRSNLRSVIEEFYEISQYRPEHCLNIHQFPYLLSGIEVAINKHENDRDYDDDCIIKFAILYHLNFPQYSLGFLNETKITDILSCIDKECVDAYKDVLKSIVKKDRFSQTERAILKNFIEQDDLNREFESSWTTYGIIEALIMQHPKFLAEHFERLHSKFMKCYDKKCIKHYSHLGLDKKICEYLLKDWKQKDHNNQVISMKIIQNLLPEEHFIEFVDGHLDDCQDKDEFLKIQQYIAGLLKKGDTARKYLPLVLKFCKGNRLSYALPSLYSLFSRSPENKLHPYIEILSKRDMSVRKHAVFLSCDFLDYNYVFNLLKSSDCSPHQYLCLAALKYFKKNSTKELFMLIEKLLVMINQSHKEIFSTLVRIRITKTYRARYIEICWKIFENVDDDTINVNKYFDKLLEQSLEEDVLKSISPLFVKNVINRHLSEHGEHRLTNIDKFAVLCLEYRCTERPNNFTTVFGTLSKSNKPIISGFCKIFIDCMYDSKPDSKFINIFIENWNKYFSTVDVINECITLNLLLKYSNHPLDEFAETVVNYLEQLFNEFGPQIFAIFKDNFEKWVNKMNILDRHNLFYSMINYRTSPALYVLIIQLLRPVNYEKTEDLKSVYKKIIQIFESSEEDVVKCCYEIYLTKYET
ncbi:unnamed protein product [Psylliodes chrysocephalus]|uniref:Uncharacterized protein n=1 Tax=Psylliodes chrysocephalus TaxID=3402493 RepID=A0A9P0CFT7_9CUCU|nr:unnamed protein product [Psylliodes chrysocephala]